MHRAARPEQLAAWAVIDIRCRIKAEVGTREGAVLPARPVKHRDMWCDALLFDKPVQHRSRAVSGIARKPVRLETKALFCSIDHGPGGADLSLANGAGCLNINNDAKLHVDEVVVGVSKKCRSFVRSGPSDRETNFGTTSLAAPHALSSRVARYSFTARLDLAGSRSLRQSGPAIERCLLASAAIRLASTAKPSPPTRSAAMQASTTRSNTRRKTSPSRKRSLRARENAE